MNSEMSSLSVSHCTSTIMYGVRGSSSSASVRRRMTSDVHYESSSVSPFKHHARPRCTLKKSPLEGGSFCVISALTPSLNSCVPRPAVKDREKTKELTL
jgi:hypothetical protein